MKSILNEGLFLTATKQKHELIHPKSLDSNIEQYMKERQAISIIGSTGIDVVSKLEGNPHNPPKETLRFDHSRSKPTHKSLKEARSNSDLDFRPERLTQHKHEKMKEKITVQSSRGQYDNYPIKPGFEFFDCLIKAPRAKITSLIQNVPESLYFSDRLYYLHTQPNLKVGVSTEIHGYRFVKIVECSRISKGDIFDNIGAIMRRRDEKIQDMQKVILDWHSFGSKISNNETFPGSLTQRYIKSPGIRPAVTRIHYSCQTKSNKANFAYFIKSLGLDEIEETNIQKCVVDMDKPETLEVFKISGPALKSFEREAENLVVFLNKAYNIRIQEIILDYLRDAAGRIWLCGCKYIKIDQTTLQNAFQPLAEWYLNATFRSLVDEKELEEKRQGLISFVHCRLCRVHYSNNELSHLVSVRMLLLYKIHVSQRMDIPWDTSHLKLTTADLLSQSVRICQFCYLLVTTEFQLIKTEEKMAEVLNIPKYNMNYEEDPKLAIQLQFLPKTLLQWRILIHPVRLYDIKDLINPQNIKICINFAGHLTTFPVKWEIENYYDEECVKLGYIRVHYIFVPEDKSLRELLSSNILEITLLLGEQPIGHSVGNFLCEMPNQLPIGCAIYQQNQIILFNDKDQPGCNLGLVMGFSCDKLIPSKKINILLNKHQHVYIPKTSYMTVDPLPKEWMELFGQDMLENQSFMDQADEEFTYTSHLSKLDMFKMEDLVSPYNSRHMNSGIMSAKSLRDIKPIAEKSKIGKFNSFDLNYDKKQTREVTKRKQKLNNNFRLEILERQIDLEEAAKPIFNTVNGYLTTRPISSKTRAILEKAPLHPNSKALKIHDRFASKTVKSRIISQRSKDSTNYDSSGLSLTSSRLQNLEKQKFLISLYSKEDQRIIENAKSEKKTKVKSRLKIKKKSEKKDWSNNSLNLDFIDEIHDGADVDKEIVEGLESVVKGPIG